MGAPDEKPLDQRLLGQEQRIQRLEREQDAGGSLDINELLLTVIESLNLAAEVHRTQCSVTRVHARVIGRLAACEQARVRRPPLL
jgi:hypothetical protein